MQDTSRPATPEGNLWDSILNSVSTRRSIPSGNVLILGEPTSGKSTLANALLQKTSPVTQPNDAEWSGKTDFALGYQWANVKEEGEEDIVARLSVYTVPSSNPAHLSLIPQFLLPKIALPRTLIVITLDWTKPWSFMDQLKMWLSWVEIWSQSDSSREAQVIREEGRERLQSHLQHYSEPSGSNQIAEPVATVASSLNSTLLPLSAGTFTHNSAGVPIIVTCTKADLIDEEEDLGLGMMKGKGGEWEERTDAVMQVLRTICMKYGAALFYTTQNPSSLSSLRQYALHLLFAPPPPPADSPPLKYPFAFSQRSNILDRDRILIPAGWDSWGKIALLRDGFDASRWGEAWERDLNAPPGAMPSGGAKDIFRSLVGEERNTAAAPLPALITTEPDQSFLGSHFETLSKDPTRDPRQQFRQPIANADSNAGTSVVYGGAGVVGPMGGSSSLNLPSVERAMAELDGDDVGTRTTRFASGSTSGPAPPRRQESRPLPNGLPSLNVPSPVTSSSNAPRSATGTSPIITPGAVSPGDGRSQHEVLQNFFASLLTNRTAAGSPTPGANGSAGSPVARRGSGAGGGTASGSD